jgi:hypothetical protein
MKITGLRTPLFRKGKYLAQGVGYFVSSGGDSSRKGQVQCKFNIAGNMSVSGFYNYRRVREKVQEIVVNSLVGQVRGRIKEQ